MPELFSEFPVTILPSLPKPQFPPLALGYVSNLHACIGSTDTIVFVDFNWPSYGRILETSFDQEAVLNDPTCVCHSLISCIPARHPNLYFKVQIYAVTVPYNSSMATKKFTIAGHLSTLCCQKQSPQQHLQIASSGFTDVKSST
jgi:hypothetical protein